MASEGESGRGEILFFGPFRLTVVERSLVKDGVPIAIGGRALDILIALTRRPGEVVSGQELIDLVWPDVFVENTNLRVHIAALRKALGDGTDGSRYIVNVPGRGYTFVAPIHRSIAEGDLLFATPVSPPGPQGLPAPRQLLFGRNETVTKLSSMLLSQRFVSVVGPGGIGKTTVAVAVAHALGQEFGDNSVCFVDLGSLTDPTVVSGAVASALGCFVQGPDPEPSILAFLADKQILIVLDSCEHVIEAVAQLTERLFRRAPSVHLLTTSREALRVEGENVHLLMPLDCPSDDASSAAEALASPAVQLFMERAAASGYRADLGDSEALIVASLCRRLDGLALAIELAASRVGTYGIQGTADLLDDGAKLLLQGRRSALPRHQTLQAMLDWSFRLLSAYEQKVLCRLSVFVGQFALEAAHSVAGEADGTTQTVTNAIVSLADKSLVRISAENGSAYFRLLDTTRAYAAARLAESGEAEIVARRHARYFADFLKAQETPELVSHGRNAAAYAPHMGNIRQALAWSFSRSGDLSIGVELAAHAAPLFLAVFSLLAECQEWCRRALDALHENDRGTRRELELQKALALSSMYLWDNSEEVRAAIEHGIELSEALQDRRHQHYLLVGLNVFLTRRGDFSGALAVAKRSAAVAESSGGAAQKVLAEWMLGASYHLTGDQAAALLHCELGLKLASDVTPAQLNFFGYDYNVRGLAYLARSLWLRGFLDQGCKVAREGINRVEGFSHPVLYCSVLLDSIPVIHWSGDLKGAAEYAERAITYATRYSLDPHRAVGLALKGELIVASGDPTSGVEILQEALKIMGANRYQVTTLATWRALAEGLARSGRLDEALATINEAVRRGEQVSGALLWLPDLLRARGEILLAQMRPDLLAAEESLLRSIEHARKQSAQSWELKAAIPLARMWGEHGRSNRACSMLDDIYQRFTEGFGSQDLVSARQLLDRLRSID